MIEAGLNVVSALVILEEQTTDKDLAGHRRRPRGRRGRAAPLGGDGAHPRSSAASTSRWSRRARRPASSTACSTASRSRSRRREDQAPREGRDDLPDRRAHLRVPRPDGMLLFLVPVFVKIFAQLGGQLPTLTQYVVERLEPAAPRTGSSSSRSSAARSSGFRMRSGPSAAAGSGTRSSCASR